MAVSIEDLINRKDEIQKGKKKQYDLKTSIGTITVKLPSRTLVLESNKLEGPGEADRYFLLNTIVDPDLRNHKLQEAYGCGEPTDIVELLFAPGEIGAISKKIVELAGYGKDIQSEVHNVAKN